MSDLLSVIDPAKLTDYHLAKIAEIDAEDLDGVAIKVHEEMDKRYWANVPMGPDYLDRGVRALKLYYVLALVDPLNEHAVSDAIDDFWHAHILDTRRYTDFCQRIFGEYLHHEPLDHAQDDEVARVEDLYCYSLSVYNKFIDGEWDYTFFPLDVPKDLLVCKHQFVNTPEIREHAAFAAR